MIILRKLDVLRLNINCSGEQFLEAPADDKDTKKDEGG
jgi:hypothetical protein